MIRPQDNVHWAWTVATVANWLRLPDQQAGGKVAKKLRAAASWQASAWDMVDRMRRMPVARMAPAAEQLLLGAVPAPVDSGAGLVTQRESPLQAQGEMVGHWVGRQSAATGTLGVAGSGPSGSTPEQGARRQAGAWR